MPLDQRITAIEDAIKILNRLFCKTDTLTAQDKVWSAKKYLEAQLSGMVADA